MASKMMEFSACGFDLQLRVGDDAFEPNTVTQRIAEVAEIKPGQEVLDLGCGVGPIGILAAKQGAAHVDSSDVVPQAIGYARENVVTNGVDDIVKVHLGDLFEPIGDRKYDVIINDVSGLQDLVSRISPWYPDPVPTGGEDGTDVVIRMMDESRDHLKDNGTLYFAVSSLSNAPKIEEKARAIYGDIVVKLKTTKIPFCEELNQAVDQLQTLKDRGLIYFEQRRSRYLWSLDVFRVQLG